MNNSPAVDCRVLDTSSTSPEGTAELFPQIRCVVLNPVLFQQRDEFLLETHFAVMRLLVFYEANYHYSDIFHLRRFRDEVKVRFQ